MATLLFTHPRFAEHDTRSGHPERPQRLVAVEEGVAASEVTEDLLRVVPEPAPTADITRVHDVAFVEALERFCGQGGGRIDADTVCSASSWEAATLAAGAGLDAIARLEAGEGEAAFCAVRPPGHHATPARSMGFCLLNNAAITAAALADRGERVAIVDIDAHHGNGTQDAFYADPRVLYVSTHEWPLYPGTGSLREVGEGPGEGTTVNLGFPAGTAGDTYRRAVDEVVVPVVERFDPSWLVLSVGYDAHRADPLTGLGLSAADYGDLTARLLQLAPAGRCIVFLEGGYDLGAVTDSTAATLAALSGHRVAPDEKTTGGPGVDVVEAARRIHDL